MKLLTSLLVLIAVGLTAFAEPKPKTVNNVDATAAEQIIKQEKDVVVLDVRTPEEFAEGHIAGAKNIDFMGDDFAGKVKALDPSKHYVVHCAAGGRSAKALKVLEANHFTHVSHMACGFNGWKEAQKPVETGAPSR